MYSQLAADVPHCYTKTIHHESLNELLKVNSQFSVKVKVLKCVY